MVKKANIMDKLEKVIDPETGLSMVDMGFIRNVEVEDPIVDIEMTLTSPGCPMQRQFTGKVKKGISELDNVDEVNVELTFDPPWSSGMMTDKGKEKLGMENE